LGGSFCFFAGGGGGGDEARDICLGGGEVGDAGCPGDDGEGECCGAVGGDGGLMLGALGGGCEDASLDA
jgi:hypothetical protein